MIGALTLMPTLNITTVEAKSAKVTATVEQTIDNRTDDQKSKDKQSKDKNVELNKKEISSKLLFI